MRSAARRMPLRERPRSPSLETMRAATPSSKKRLRVVALAGLLITSTTLLFAGLPPAGRLGVEAALYASGIILLVTQPAMCRLLAALPGGQRTLVFVMVGILTGAQLWSNAQQTFPFIPWAMYAGQRPHPPTWYEYLGICEDGREVEIRAARVFRTQKRTIPWLLMSKCWAMDQADSEAERMRLDREYGRLLRSLVRRFNATNPGADVVRVRVVECRMPRPAPGRELPVTRTVAGVYEVQP